MTYLVIIVILFVVDSSSAGCNLSISLVTGSI
jgi:hypothetical protein